MDTLIFNKLKANAVIVNDLVTDIFGMVGLRSVYEFEGIKYVIDVYQYDRGVIHVEEWGYYDKCGEWVELDPNQIQLDELQEVFDKVELKKEEENNIGVFDSEDYAHFENLIYA
ncbi:MAG: hypothetical protein KGV59_06160 [Tenacibaculum sp.]|nr:hypothetical protein [Tenacibaculum sp.]